LSNVHVALDKVAVLSLQVHGAVEFVVAELGMDGSPDRVRRGLGGAHDGAYVFVDGDVDPGQDALIQDDLVGVTALLSS
jgi:hypothetical protein